MTRKQRRGTLIIAAIAVLGLAAILTLFALKDSIVFFHTPSDIAEKNVPLGQRIRLGGLVAEGSVKRGSGTDVLFAVTDTLKTVPVSFKGVLPDLFREGQGVVAEGVLDAGG
ncbi:MAG: cytochrome c maturation protein CcmE, partial [Hyphomicrobiaceae bacterium]|nr:cytochrome c maturation protein CcmE [Hyphomicrobiaceae bacterium]